MAITFNADEIFGIGEKIERNGEKFYTLSAQRVADPKAKKVLQDLAGMERNHLKVFQDLHAQIDQVAVKETTWDPDGEGPAYLQATADSHIFRSTDDPTTLLADAADPKEILELALQFEKDSVIYFRGVAEVVPEHLGKADVLELAKQEQNHIVLIQKTLSKL